jgi:hypothetical protein
MREERCNLNNIMMRRGGAKAGWRVDDFEMKE